MPPLYRPGDADALTRSEQEDPWRIANDQRKIELVLEHSDGVESLLDIGCGSGQLLEGLVGEIPRLAGVDESRQRLESVGDLGPTVTLHETTAEEMDLGGRTFDVALTSHVVHEFVLFGASDTFDRVCGSVASCLTPGGRWFIIDHRDPGEGDVTIGLDEHRRDQLDRFADRFELRDVTLDIDGDKVTLDRRDCHDFVTKIWALGTEAEDLEMRETHTVLGRSNLEEALASGGFEITRWLPITPITVLMDHYGIELVDGDPWNRQLFCIAEPHGQAEVNHDDG